MPLTSKITFLLLLLYAIWFVVGVGATAAQQTEALTHAVEPGDTWQALSRRYGVSVDALQAANPHPNRERQPAIGTHITIAAAGAAPAQNEGHLVRSEAGLWRLALRYGKSPWQLALLNEVEHPYRPSFYRPLFIPAVGETPRDLPVGFKSLELSHVPGLPGEGMAFRARIVPGSVTAATVSLGPAGGHLVTHDDRAVGLIGTGAFFKPGRPELTIHPAGRPLWSQPWLVVDKEWTYNQITLTGDAAEISQADIEAERARLFQLWGHVTPNLHWQTPFTEPITDYLEYSSLYGARRSYNGGPYRTYHEGLDFSAYGGTAVFAPAGGVVALAEELYVRGGAVIIDHGLGIYTGYYHLSEVSVEAGQSVAPGDKLGGVGTTGFSTGNHLHWDLLVSGVWVDPAAWLERDTACWIAAGWGTPCTRPQQ